MAFSSGDVLQNRYRIVKLLAQGGFGTLYRAWDSLLGRPCVVKENLTTTQEGQRQFLREAKILANLSHPNLPRVTDYFLVPRQGQYLVMDFVEGQDLQQMIEDRGGPFPETRVLPWASQICDALAFLHSQTPPVIHRDVKPANIRITPENKAVLVDFGIAKTLDPSIKTTLGAQAVSPGYSPVEQYGKAKTDARSDIYALGATLYTLLTGQEPPESLQRVVHDPYVPPRQVNPNLSMRISAAINRSMQLDPSQRFQNAADFKSALTPPPPVQIAPPIKNYQSPVKVLSSSSATRTIPWNWITLTVLLSLIILILIFVMLKPKEQAPTLHSYSPQAASPQVTKSLIDLAIVSPTMNQGQENSEVIVPTLTPLIYKVQSGDTCSEIGEAFGVSISEIVKVNPEMASDCGFLYADQSLLIPQPDGPISTPIAIRSPRPPSPEVTQLSEQDGMSLVYIPAGEFSMGAEEGDPVAAESEKSLHQVYLDSFWIDLTEVSNRMYIDCVQAGSCQSIVASSQTRPQYFDEKAYDDFPVISVSWENAKQYCTWAGRRLPTEAEWEKAARGTGDRVFPWGNEPPNPRRANFGNQLGDTAMISSYPDGASPYGVLNLAGNAAEWVADWYGPSYYEVTVYKNPTGPQSGEFKLIRGGSWFTQAQALRVSSRLWNYPGLRSDTVGFRCAK